MHTSQGPFVCHTTHTCAFLCRTTDTCIHMSHHAYMYHRLLEPNSHVTIFSSFTHVSPSPLGTHEGGRAAVAPSPRAPATDSPRLCLCVCHVLWCLTHMSPSLCGSFMSATPRDLCMCHLTHSCVCHQHRCLFHLTHCQCLIPM